jgi:iduronate 2-sulfatase
MVTPSIDKLASRPGATLFRKNYVQMAVCAASRASILTSRRPDSSKYGEGYWRETAGNFTTIPEFFRLEGYETIGMGKLFHGGEHSGDYKKGLASDDVGLGPGTYSWSKPYYHANAAMHHYPYGGVTWRAIQPAEEASNPLADSVLAENAVKELYHLANRSTDTEDFEEPKTKPFFLGVGFHRPHLPFIFPAKLLDSYPLDKISMPVNPFPPKGMPLVAW